jgi:hypothetical protein
MGHDATKVLMGTTQSSSKEAARVFESSPLTFLAGLAVRRANTGLLSVTKAAGGWVGISLGKSLSDTLKTTVLGAGERVPVLIERQPARGIVTITSYANLVDGTDDTITVGVTAFTAQAGASTPGQAHFTAATGNNETATSFAAQVNAHATAGALVKATVVGAVVTLTALSNTSSGDTIALSVEQLGTGDGATVSGATLTDSDDTSDFVTIGGNVYFSDTTGKADDPNSGATVSNAVYVSGQLIGIAEDGTEVACALVDMPGGL